MACEVQGAAHTRVAACALAALALAAACTGDEQSSSEVSTEVSTETVVATDPDLEPVPTVKELPGAVAETRRAILAAATAQDYDALEALVDAEIFCRTPVSESIP
jgi:hypothetical protein